VPIYDYVCETCGHVLEVVHGIDADGPAECPQCGGPMSKAFSAPAVHFKGSGWAKKDRKSVSGPVKSRPPSDGGGEGTTGSSDAPAASGGTAGSDASPTASGGTTPSGGTAADGSKEG
jgi:putative FmdB family regulatory protein